MSLKDSLLSDDLENWMTKLPQELRSRPIIYLAIPGTHDSFTAKITSSSNIAPDAEPILQGLKFLGPFLKFFMKNWSKTQALLATEQLLNGIRYFDLRIATRKNTDDLYFVHGLYSEEVRNVLNEIHDFLQVHPQEVVILDCQHFYGFTQDDHERLMRLLTSVFGPKLLPYSVHMDFITLEYMTSQFRYQVIAIYRSDAARFGQPLLWPSMAFPNPWPNTISKNELFNFLNNGLKNRPLGMGYISQCVLTPTIPFIFKNIYSTLKQKCAIGLQERRMAWLADRKKGINIIITDYVDLDTNLFAREVIEINSTFLNNYGN